MLILGPRLKRPPLSVLSLPKISTPGITVMLLDGFEYAKSIVSEAWPVLMLNCSLVSLSSPVYFDKFLCWKERFDLFRFILWSTLNPVPNL
jgi:hypothetical protein